MNVDENIRVTGSETDIARYVYYGYECIGSIHLIKSKSKTRADAYTALPVGASWIDRDVLNKPVYPLFKWKEDQRILYKRRAGDVTPPEVALKEAIAYLLDVWKLENTLRNSL